MPRLKKYSAKERQEGKRDLEDQLPSQFFTFSREWYDEQFPYPHEHWDDWHSYKPYTENTIGGKFLQVLTKLSIVQEFAYDPFRGKHRNQEVWWLYEMLAVAPSGYVYVSDNSGEIYAVKLDIPKNIKLLDSSVTKK